MSSLSQSWYARLNGTANSHDAAYSIDVDISQNVYICGQLVNTTTGNDFFLAKYNSSGAHQWTVLKNGDNFSDRANSLVVDAGSNLYVCGYLYSSITSNDAWIYKYNSSGVQQWAISVVGIGGSEDKANYITKDGSGNIYVCGYTVNNSSNDEDVLTMKISPAGSVLWQQTFNAPSSLRDQGTHLFVDASGNVYVAGRSSPSAANDYDYVTLMYNSSGTLQWSALYNGTGNLYDEAASVTADAGGNCYVTGKSWGTVNYDMCTIKYNSSGAQQWIARYTSQSIGTTVKLSSDGSSIVSGYTTSGPGNFLLVKYNSSGVQQWQSLYNDPLNQSNIATSMEIDQDGTIIVAGHDYDARIVKFYSDGTFMGMVSYDYGITGGENLYALKLDALGNVFAAGGSYGGTSTLTDVLTLIHPVSALPVTLNYFNSSTKCNNVHLEWETANELNNKGFEIQKESGAEWKEVAFIHGSGTSNTPVKYSYTEKYVQSGNYNYRLKQIDFNGNCEYHNLNNQVIIGKPTYPLLFQNYPNPSNPNSQINYQISNPGKVKISVFDITGKEVSVLIDGFMEAGYYSVIFDGRNFSSGVYFYSIAAEEYTTARKMLLIK